MKQSVFAQDGTWYKGNLHSHSTMSDGVPTPEERAAMYQAAGYSFLALTDHNVFASYPELCNDHFLMIPATERDVPDPDNAYYCLHAVGISEEEVPEKVHQVLESCTANHIYKPWQQLLNEMRDAGQLIILAHPIWSRNTVQEFIDLDGYLGMEIYNNLCEMDGHTGKAEYFADSLLRTGKHAYLFAEDDCHGIDWLNHGRDTFGGWIQVKAKELTHKEIISQIKAGSFYASTGPEIYDYGTEDGKIYVECSPCEQIHFVSYPYRGRSFFDHGLTSASFTPAKGSTFVRCECIDAQGKVAYTNPIFFD